MLVTGLLPVRAQGSSPESQPQPQFFSGTITALSDTEVTVIRTVLGKNSATRTFVLTPETRIEGKPKVKARVTVRYIPDENGDRAVHIIVRPSPKK